MAAEDSDQAVGTSRRRPRGVDLADIRAGAGETGPTTADREIAAAVAAAKVDRIGQIATGAFDGTTSGALKRALEQADPLRTAIERAGLLRGGVGDRAVRDALLGRDLVSRAAELGVLGSLGDRMTAAAIGGSLIDRTSREIADAHRKMTDLALGRGLGTELSAYAVGKDRLGHFDTGLSYATGRTAMAALEDTYASLGIGRRRDRLLGVVSGVGSLARIAACLADPAEGVRTRFREMVAQTQARIDASVGLATIGGALHRDYGDLFPAMRQPRTSEIEAVIAGARGFAELKPYPDWESEAKHRFEQLTAPWVRDDLPDASIAAMARLQGLGALVERAAPAERDVVRALRENLGDYRKGRVPKPSELADPVARTGYLLERGFDPVLTVLPTAVVAVMFAPLGPSDFSVAVDPDQVENMVRMLLKRLELALRRFIAAKLASLYGEAWFDALPADIRRSWSKGRQKDIDAGRTPDDLIAYADIDHYRKIIEHPDRWKRLFEPVFKDQGAIRETLRRIAVIRNPGAHFRAVTLEDLIILRAEGVHLAKWLGVRFGD